MTELAIEMEHYKELAMEIVYYAVLDWRRLVKSKAWKKDHRQRTYNYWQIPSVRCNFDEIRDFFRSGWCDTILTTAQVSTSSERILELLEAELEEAKKADEKRERRKKK